MKKLLFKVEFDLDENEPVCETHFQRMFSTRRLVVIQSQKEVGNGLLLNITFPNRASLKVCVKDGAY